MSDAAARRPNATARAQTVKRTHGDELLGKANVVGVGVGYIRRGGLRTDEVGLVVLVKHKRPANELAEDDLVPTQIDGVPVDVQEVGEIVAQE